MSTLTLHLTEEQVRHLTARAASMQKTLEEYVIGLSEQSSISYDEWRDRLRALSDDLPRPIPPISDAMLNREELYGE